MADTLNTKVLIIAGGIGGYVCAIRLGQLGSPLPLTPAKAGVQAFLVPEAA